MESDQRTDRKVAEKVMGFRQRRVYHGSMPTCETCLCDASGKRHHEAPRYTSDPRADYTVLEHVRECWGSAGIAAFAQRLQDIYLNRPTTSGDEARDDGVVLHIGVYRTGDYARAALAVVEQDREGASP